MRYDLSFDYVRDRIGSDSSARVWVSAALWRRTPDEPYAVMRWWAYVVPAGMPWEPWKGDLVHAYEHWRLIRFLTSSSELNDQLSCWASRQPYQNGAEEAWAFPMVETGRWQEDRWWAFSSPQWTHRLVPYTTWRYKFEVNGNQVHESDHDNEFIAVGEPYYPTVRDALRSFADGVPSPPYGDSIRTPEYGLFIIDVRPRLSRVVIRRAYCVVEVEGYDGQTCELKSFTTEPLETIAVDRSGTYEIPWTSVPASADWVLIRGQEILDRKLFSQQKVFGTGVRVEIDWGEPDTLHEWVAQGEGPQTEFKKDIPADGHDLAETACAFANTNGGRIFIGVDDNAQVVGTKLPDKWEERIRNTLRNLIEPTLDVAIEHVPWGVGKSVVIIQVTSGDQAFAVGRDRPVWYLRVGSTDMPARYEDVAQMLGAKALRYAPHNSPWRRYLL